MTQPFNQQYSVLFEKLIAFVDPTIEPAEVIRRIVAKALLNTTSLLDTVALIGDGTSVIPLQVGFNDEMIDYQAMVTDVHGRLFQATALCLVKGLHGHSFSEEENDRTKYYVLIRATAIDQVATSDVLRLDGTIEDGDELYEEVSARLTPFV